MFRSVRIFLSLFLITNLILLSGGGLILGAGEQDPSNLLVNPGFELGEGATPLGWRGVRLPGSQGEVRFLWDPAYADSGDRSVQVSASEGARGIWSQVVPVAAGCVYEISGFVAFEDLGHDADAHIQVVFRDAENRVLEFVDLARHHTGTREFDLDYPARMMVRAPAGSMHAEVNGYLQGPGTVWYDGFVFRPAPLGTISGHVTSDGGDVVGARVFLWGDPWGDVMDAVTDSSGEYLLVDVPVTHPRYVVIAEKDGYRSQPAGDVSVAAGHITRLDFELLPGSDPEDDLEVGYGFISVSQRQNPLSLPEEAVLPGDPDGYPEEIRPYLEADAYITSDDPVVQHQADLILAGLPEEERVNAVAVARAVYEWVSTTLNHDAVYGSGRPYLDVTSGIWQTIQPGGWCWGRSFYDWLYRPSELMAEGTGICIEHSWLSAALLRALNIPARARVGSAQFWIFTGEGTGTWFGMSTNGGSNTYRETGILGTGFGDSGLPVFYSATSEPFLHEDWDWTMPGLWRERHPWGEAYPATEGGIDQAIADLEAYARTGRAPRSAMKRIPGAGTATINYSQITLSRLSLASQPVIDVRFPAPTESAATHDTGEWSYWTNHPECVVNTYVETLDDLPSGEIQRWRHIVFDVSELIE